MSALFVFCVFCSDGDVLERCCVGNQVKEKYWYKFSALSVEAAGEWISEDFRKQEKELHWPSTTGKNLDGPEDFYLKKKH